MTQQHEEKGPAQSPSTYEDAVEVARSIQPALNKLILIFQRTAEGSSLTTSQVSIMNQLRMRGPSRVSTIAQAELIRKQQNGGGIVIGFEVADTDAAWKVVDGVELFSRTANLGDVRSTITHPWTTTHGRMQPEEKLAANIRPGLVRLSVGLEYVDDLIDDLKQALAR